MQKDLVMRELKSLIGAEHNMLYAEHSMKNRKTTFVNHHHHCCWIHPLMTERILNAGVYELEPVIQ
jgi:hypothetical protein